MKVVNKFNRSYDKLKAFLKLIAYSFQIDRLLAINELYGDWEEIA